MTYWGRSHAPCWCYWDRTPSLSLPWWFISPQPLLFRSYISPLPPCLVTSATEDGDSMFLRNFGIDLQIRISPISKVSATNKYHIFMTTSHIFSPPKFASLKLRCGLCALSKVRRRLRHNLWSQPYGSKSLVRSTGSAVWISSYWCFNV
jgi:hypothetical protein